VSSANEVDPADGSIVPGSASPTAVADALEETLRALQRDHQALTEELAALRAARSQSESLLAVLAEWGLFMEGAAHDRMRLLREAPRLLVPRLADAATLEVAAFGPRPWAAAHIDPARAAALESGEARPRSDVSSGVQRVALVDGGRTLGWLTVWWERPQPVSPALAMVLSMLAQQAAAVLAEAERHTRRADSARAKASLGAVIEQELGKPLQALALSLEMVDAVRSREEPLAPGWLDERLKAMRLTAGRMQRGMEVLLAADAICERRVAVAPEPFDLVELTRSVTDQVSRDVGWKGSTFFVDGDASVPGRWDRTCTQLVLGILLRDVAKAAPGTPVGVRVRLDGGAQIAISTRGPLPGSDGTSSQRGDGAAVDGDSGEEAALLGLWVARELVAALNGTMSASTSADGAIGFRVDLPLPR
jgi:signal transduction histidine kinase